ncbi:MAG: bifunctional DNA primase/polymerase [Candidatus Entotheonellia bacterium]
MSSLAAEGIRLTASGLSVIPIKPDGSKAPAVAWQGYQSRRPTLDELAAWFTSGRHGLAILGGAISGNLEIVDFDDVTCFGPWADLIEELSPGLLTRLPAVKTPSDGRHVYYRCPVIEGNQKLAQRPDADGKPKTAIETRGEGGYVLAPGCPLACHPAHKPYVLLDGDLGDIPPISPEERSLLLNAARTFNTYVASERGVSERPAVQPHAIGDRPGDLFNARVSWETILTPHGWTRVGQRGELTLWKRPGKREGGWSATTNYGGSNLLYLFSSNAPPFEPETAYSKFAAYALLEHEGDFQAAAKGLVAQGYGDHHEPQERDPASAPGATHGSAPYRGYRGYQPYRGYGREVSHG